MTRWRWLFVVMLLGSSLLIPPGSADPAPAQTAPNGTRMLASSGTPGTFSANLKVGRCRYTETGGLWQTAIELPAPTVTPRAGVTDQRITWEPRLYQAFSDLPARQLLRQEALQSHLAPGGAVTFSTVNLTELPQGPAYQTGGRIVWYSGNVEIGAIEFIFTQHDSFIATRRISQGLPHCMSAAPAELGLSTYRTTVNVRVTLSGRYFPISAPVRITWNGKTIGETLSDANGQVVTSIRVPAAPAGSYRFGLEAGTLWQPHQLLTVVPRVKVIPDQAARGETVKISLRGFAKKESVRIRWMRNGAWVEIGWVNTSKSGSGELWIPAPTWAADGANSVRGDGPGARAQTNVVMITGGPSVSLTNEEPVQAATPAPDPAEPEEPTPPLDAATPIAEPAAAEPATPGP